MIYREARTTPPSPIYKTEASVRPIYREEVKQAAESLETVVSLTLVRPSS